MFKPKLTKSGLPGYEVTRSHNDVNGIWDGHKTWIVHYNDGCNDRLALHTYLGWYWDVGRQPGENHSRHEVASLFNELLRDGVPIGWMYWLVKAVTVVWRTIKRG